MPKDQERKGVRVEVAVGTGERSMFMRLLDWRDFFFFLFAPPRA